ncbi:MAG: bifunctional heptose 7-phosphate kinase/heptose 1-phosphate adenyltransferase [Vicinamibacterales bacterium]
MPRQSPSEQPATDRLLEIIARFRSCSLLVLGDLIADEYVYGHVARVSREAPVLILEYDSTEVVAGGAGNAASNVAALGGRARLAALLGRDEAGRRLLATLPRGVDPRGIVRPVSYRTPVKTRILAGGIHSAKQQVVRIDRRSSGPVDADQRAAVERAALEAAPAVDAVIVSDYGAGLVQPRTVSRVARAARAGRRRVPVLVDSRYALTRFSGLTACTPNESEVEQVLGVTIDDRLDVLESAGRTLLERTRMEAVLITRGGRGMALFEPHRPTVHIEIHGSDQIADVTGAGDTVMATLTLALAAGGTVEEAARLANYAGGLVVMKRGTATVSAGELAGAVRG